MVQPIPKKVLMVEDDPIDARALLKLIDRKSYDVKHVDSLEKAQQALLQKNEVDLILVDLNLSDSNGIDTINRLKAVSNGIPLIIISGHSLEDNEKGLVFQDTEDYIKKSILKNFDINQNFAYAISRKEKETEILFQKDMALELLEQRSKFIQFLAHEIRTPLNGICGMTELLQDHIHTEDAKDIYEPLKASADSLRQLVDNLLDLEKSEKGLMSINLEEIELNSIVEELTLVFGVQSQMKQLKFETECDSVKTTIFRTDRMKLLQIANNLLSNSIKYTKTGKIVLRMIMADNCLKIEVEDTGRGIAESDKEKIFEPFQQAKKLDENSGTGLGLPICRTIAGLLGGEIWVEDGSLGGSHFICRLPNLRT